MASPQKENGYTVIANEIMEHLAMPGINGSEYRLLFVIWRKTYGFNKKIDQISLTQFQNATFMNRAQVVKTIRDLVEKKILIKVGGEYQFNKNWEEWEVSKREGSMQKHTSELFDCTGMQKDTSSSMQKHTKTGMQKHTYKRKKEIIKETKESTLIPEVIKLFEEINPACKKMYGNKTQRQACDDLINTYGFDEVSKYVTFLPKSNKMPFFPVITTPLELWYKFTVLKEKIAQKRSEFISKEVKVAF